MRSLAALLLAALLASCAYYFWLWRGEQGPETLTGLVSFAYYLPDSPAVDPAPTGAPAEESPDSCLRWGPFASHDLPGARAQLQRYGLAERARLADRFAAERYIAYLGPYDNRTAALAFVKQFRQQGYREAKPILSGELSYGVEIASFPTQEKAEAFLAGPRAPAVKGIRVTNLLGEPTDRVDLIFVGLEPEQEGQLRQLGRIYPSARLIPCAEDGPGNPAPPAGRPADGAPPPAARPAS